MDYFNYRDGKLFCEGVDIAQIAAEVGTPAYIYSGATLLHHYGAMAEAFAAVDPLICFSVKSLANLHVLKLLAAAGSGFDVVSGGELARVKAAGGDTTKVVFAGVGKTDLEIVDALNANIALFNVESEAEFANISRLAAETGIKTRAALRINPDVYDPKTHSYTTTGKKETKFGVDIDRAEAFFAAFGGDENVKLDAIHLHIGSPIYSPQPYVDAISKVLPLIDKLRADGLEINMLNIGGGFAADYEVGKSPLAVDYANAIVPLLVGKGLSIVIEPGRQIAANSGILLTKVLYRKAGGEKKFVILDAAMTDMIRPALYQAEQFIYPIKLADGDEGPTRSFDFTPPNAEKVDLVGGVCETADFLAKDRLLPPVSRDDLLAVFSAGAYGFVMSSQYNSRPRAVEVLVEGETFRVIRRRETYDDLFAAELDV